MRRPAIVLALLAALICMAAADTEYKQVRIHAIGQAVNVRLPLTDVTGKVRVKARRPNGLGEPVSPLHTRLDEHDYLEWQIGYDTLDPHHPSLAIGVSFLRKGEVKYGIELAQMLVEALHGGIISREQLQTERAFLSQTREKNFEEKEHIALEKSPAQDLPGDFTEYVERVPMFAKETPHGRIEIVLKPKQRAVGNQAMVYVCLKLTDLLDEKGQPRPPGAAHSKETVNYRFTKKNAGFLFDIVRAFGIASRQHNEDLTNILDCLLATP